MASWIASIPSPSDGVFSIGPLDIHAYGLMIALGVVAAVALSGRRLEAAGVGPREDMSSIALWGGNVLYFDEKNFKVVDKPVKA